MVAWVLAVAAAGGGEWAMPKVETNLRQAEAQKAAERAVVPVPLTNSEAQKAAERAVVPLEV